MDAASTVNVPVTKEAAVALPVVVKFSFPNEIAPLESVILPSASVKVPTAEPVAAVKTPHWKSAIAANVKSSVEAPVKVPVATTILSADSSQPTNTLALVPLSITKPASPEGSFVVPLANSINLSLIIELVVWILV